MFFINKTMQDDAGKIINILKSRVFTVVLLVFIVLLGSVLYRDYLNQREVLEEINKLEEETMKLRGKNLELSRLISILETSNYIEQEARKNLGLKKPGENVVSIPENARPKKHSAGEPVSLDKRPSNAVLWFEYFFKNNKGN